MAPRLLVALRPLYATRLPRARAYFRLHSHTCRYAPLTCGTCVCCARARQCHQRVDACEQLYTLADVRRAIDLRVAIDADVKDALSSERKRLHHHYKTS